MAERKAEEANAAAEAEAANAEAQNATMEQGALMGRGLITQAEQAAARRLDADKRAREAEMRRVTLLVGDDPDVLWVMSNRVDDRVVLSERDDRHPGGEAFVAGSAPEHVFRTPMVAQLLNDGLLIEVPEPKDGPRRPLALPAAGVIVDVSNQPGQVIRLGRTPDPELYTDAQKKEIEKAQAAKPSEVAVPRAVIVPQPPAAERETAARANR